MVQRLVMVVVLAAVAALPACAGDDAPPAATIDDSPARSTTTTVGVDEVPDEITVEYVQRVMDALDQSWGEMFRLYVAEGGPTAETEAWLEALYDEPALSAIRSALGQEAADGFDTTRQPPGDPVTEVRDLVRGDATCVLVAVHRSYERVLNVTPDEETSGGHLALVRSSGDETRNATAWKLALEDPDSTTEEAEAACEQR